MACSKSAVRAADAPTERQELERVEKQHPGEQPFAQEEERQEAARGPAERAQGNRGLDQRRGQREARRIQGGFEGPEEEIGGERWG